MSWNGFKYDPSTGIFVGRRGRPVLGRNDCGYVKLQWREGGRKMQVYAHRVAWLIMHGRWPAQFIDHINRNRADNRIANLRDVPRIENYRNASLGRAPNGKFATA